MTVTTSWLESVLQHEINSWRFVLPHQHGVEVMLPDKSSLTHLFNNREGHNVYNQALCALTDDGGFVVLRGASAQIEPNVTLTSDVDGGLVQDPFHRDYRGAHLNGVTVLTKHLFAQRNIPTVYASRATVQRAISQLSLDGKSPIVQEALRTMSRPDYGFSFQEHEMPARNAILDNYPTFTGDVINLIPPAEKHAVAWERGQRLIVIHSNQTDTLHARPFGEGYKTNCLISVYVRSHP